jgi:DNA polymerase-3 subunit epsilon
VNWQRLLGLEFARKHALRKAAPGALADYLSQTLPPPKLCCRDSEILALDFETTGFDPKKDHIISVGCVLLRNWGVDFSTARHRYIKIDSALPEASVVVHQITDDTASSQGEDLEEVMAWLLMELKGRVLLAHHSKIELSFLDQTCRRLYGAPFIARSIDTLRIAQRRFSRRNEVLRSGDLRLFNLRERYHLPQYKAHNALSDAISTAELFLALVAEGCDLDACRLNEFLD